MGKDHNSSIQGFRLWCMNGAMQHIRILPSFRQASRMLAVIGIQGVLWYRFCRINIGVILNKGSECLIIHAGQ